MAPGLKCPFPLDPPQPEASVPLLVVSSSQADLVSVQSILKNSNWEIHGAPTCREALAFLRQNVIPVLLCECDLPDGNWKDILKEFALLADPPRLIVTSRLADEGLWAEVLNLGGHDVLMKPFHPHEVPWVISLAWRHWKSVREQISRDRNEARPTGGGGSKGDDKAKPSC